MYDDIDWMVGDDIDLTTHRKALFMKEEFNQVRMKVLRRFETTDTETYILPDGTTSTADEAWIAVVPNVKYWRDVRWNYSLLQVGSYKFVLEARKRRIGMREDGSFNSPPSLISEAIIEVRWKKALAEVSLSSGGLPAARSAVALRLDEEGVKVVDNARAAWLLGLEFHRYYLDYEDYLLYTRPSFDSITLTT